MSFFKNIKEKISNIFTKSNNIEDIEDVLVEADFGIELASKIALQLKKSQDINGDFEAIISDILSPHIQTINTNRDTTVIMMVGVNGTGKTTTVAKLANYFQNLGKSVDIAACDTFRAAAVDQIEKWANKLECKLFRGQTNSDPASIAYDAVTKSHGDILIIDTAGRMHNNQNLMGELQKIDRVLKKYNPDFPHETIITVDATSGQNTKEQIKTFGEYCKLTGVILTKMDSNAKGGTIVGIIDKYKIPIYGVGTGESFRDFDMFDVKKFCKIM